MSRISNELIERIRVMTVIIPVLVWIAFLWERFTGLTFVFSKHMKDLGNNSSAAHLHSMLEAAIGVTLICVPLFFLCGVWLRQQGE